MALESNRNPEKLDIPGSRKPFYYATPLGMARAYRAAKKWFRSDMRDIYHKMATDLPAGAIPNHADITVEQRKTLVGNAQPRLYQIAYHTVLYSLAKTEQPIRQLRSNAHTQFELQIQQKQSDIVTAQRAITNITKSIPEKDRTPSHNQQIDIDKNQISNLKSEIDTIKTERDQTLAKFTQPNQHGNGKKYSTEFLELHKKLRDLQDRSTFQVTSKEQLLTEFDQAEELIKTHRTEFDRYYRELENTLPAETANEPAEIQAQREALKEMDTVRTKIYHDFYETQFQDYKKKVEDKETTLSQLERATARNALIMRQLDTSNKKWKSWKKAHTNATQLDVLEAMQTEFYTKGKDSKAPYDNIESVFGNDPLQEVKIHNKKFDVTYSRAMGSGTISMKGSCMFMGWEEFSRGVTDLIIQLKADGYTGTLIKFQDPTYQAMAENIAFQLGMKLDAPITAKNTPDSGPSRSEKAAASAPPPVARAPTGPGNSS